MSDKYGIYESIGSAREVVRSYEDLSNHHPSKHFQERRKDGSLRDYGIVDGHKEEIIKHGQQILVSKDFVLYDSSGASKPNEVDANDKHVPVPSPVNGRVKVDRSQGKVDIYDPNSGELLVRIRHMSAIPLKNDDMVVYGQPLGTQDKVSTASVHVHMDFNINHLDKFKQYVNDIDSGVITIDKSQMKVKTGAFPHHTDAGLTVKELSHAHQTLVAQSHEHIHRLYKEHGLPIDQGTQNTILSLAVAASERGMNRIDHAVVKEGNINVAQINGMVAHTASINGNIAANTPVEQSLHKLAELEQSQVQQMRQQSQQLEQPQLSRSMV